MPHAVDKIIINGNTTEGTHAAIMKEYDTLNKLGAEILAKGWEADPEQQKLKQVHQALCDAHDKADLVYLQGLRELVKDHATFIDGHK